MHNFEYIKITKHLHVIITFINFTIIALLLLTVWQIFILLTQPFIILVSLTTTGYRRQLRTQ